MVPRSESRTKGDGRPRLREQLRKEFGANLEGDETLDSKDSKAAHWLFHHAVNSIRVIERKMEGVGEQTKAGILTHSWSPWSPASKFGVPPNLRGAGRGDRRPDSRDRS